MTDEANSGVTNPNQSSAPAPAASDGAASGASASSPTNQTTTTAPETKPAAKERPTYLPEKFWNAETGIADYDGFSKEYGELAALKAEADARKAAVPEKPEGYKVELPKDLKLPEGIEVNVDANDPMLQEFRAFAHAKGIGQDQFNEFVGLYVKHQAAQAAALQAFHKAEFEKLGDNAQGRIDAVAGLLHSKIGDDAKFLAPLMQSERTVRAFEKLAKAMTGGGANAPANGGDTKKTLTQDEYDRLSTVEKITYARQLNGGTTGRSAAH